MQILVREQVLARPRPEVFDFFSNAENLERITPKFLNFRMVTPTPIPMGVGTLIDYRLSLFGAPFGWRTLIEEWVPEERFVDTQLRGPYALWHHTHLFEDAPGGGTLMRDVVRYEAPLGPLGRVAERLFVDRTVERIFDFRREATERLFG